MLHLSGSLPFLINFLKHVDANSKKAVAARTIFRQGLEQLLDSIPSAVIHIPHASKIIPENVLPSLPFRRTRWLLNFYE